MTATLKNYFDSKEKLITILFRTYYIPLCAFSLKYVGRKDVAEDIVAETFFKIWKNQEEISMEKSLKSYLFKAVYNNSMYYLRQLKNEGKLENYYKESVFENIGFHHDMHQPYRSLMLDELGDRIEKAVEELPQQQKNVFRFKRVDGLKLREIAEQMGISVKTVEMHLSKAILTLRSKLKDCLLVLLSFLFFQ